MDQNEKRKALRRKVHIPVLCWDNESGKRIGKGKEIVTKDLSGDGIAFYSQQSYPLGARLIVDICLPNQKEPVSCNLEVVSVEAILHKEEFLTGAAFLDQPGRVDEILGIVRVFLDARCDREDIRIEDDVLGREARLFDE